MSITSPEGAKVECATRDSTHELGKMSTARLPAKLLKALIIVDSPASLLQASRVIDEVCCV